MSTSRMSQPKSFQFTVGVGVAIVFCITGLFLKAKSVDVLSLYFFTVALCNTINPPVNESHSAKPLYPPGTLLQAHLPTGEVQIEFLDKTTRRYSWRQHDSNSRFTTKVNLYNADAQGNLYNPGANYENLKKMLDCEKTIIVQEVHYDFNTIQNLEKALQETLNSYDAVYSKTGLLVGANKDYSNFIVEQFTLKGHCPTNLAGATDSAIPIKSSNIR